MAKQRRIIVGEWGYGSRGCGHIVCDQCDYDAVMAAYESIEDGDLSSDVLAEVQAAGGRYVESVEDEMTR